MWLKKCLPSQCDGANHSSSINHMTYLVKTFRGHSYASNHSQADELAADMLKAIMRDGYPDDYWWVKVVNCDTQDFRIIYTGNLADHLINEIDKSTKIMSTRWIKN